MLVIDNGDAIRGIAEVATKLDFIVNGYVGTTATQLADGQLGTSEADLYASGANATVVTSITIVNTDSVARTFTLYLKPGATSRVISPKSLDLGVGHCFYTDGQRMLVMDLAGQILSGWTVDDTPVNGEVNQPISSNWAFDHEGAADPHTGYRLESADHSHQTAGAQAGKIDHGAALDGLGGDDHPQYIKDSEFTAADEIIVGTGSGTFGQVTLAASQFLAKKSTGVATNITAAQARTILNVADGATAYVDADAVSAVEAAGLTFAENKGIILDAVLSVDGKYSGFIEEGTAGAVLAFGDIVQQASDSEWELANATNAAGGSGRLGMCVLAQGGGAGNPTTVLIYGKIRAATLPALTVGGKVYLKTVAGDVDISAPTGTTDFVVRIIGYGNTAEDLFFCPDNTYIELA